MKLDVPLDLALFGISATAMLAYRMSKNQPCRHARTDKSVNFGKNTRVEMHPSIRKMLFPGSSDAIKRCPPIIGLLFAASWCPDCSEIVPRTGQVAALDNSNLIDIYYVSSDTSENEMLQFKPPCMFHIPFSYDETRSQLKRKFAVCAQKEMNDLGIGMSERKHGIPTLILLNAATGKILAEHATEDIVELSPRAALSKWSFLLS
jgi:nucleoredoxin